MTKTTIKLVDVIGKANAFLNMSPDDKTSERETLHRFVADLLLASDAYAGFGYIQGYNKGDNTRTMFYIHSKLRAAEDRRKARELDALATEAANTDWSRV